jgi:DnaJ-class molecular chaperone
MKRSFYEIIGVPHDADRAAIDAAYTRVMEHLNDGIKRGVADATMEAQLVRDGYQILSDPAKRTRYDAKLSASESGVQLMFFPEDKGAQKKLGVQTVIFALLATTFCGVVYWQLNRKISEVRADYASVVVRKQSAQNLPKVTNTPENPSAQQEAPSVVDASRVVPMIKGDAGKDGKQ